MQPEPSPTDTPASPAGAVATAWVASGGVSPWWRALAIAALIIIALCITTAASMFEQFKAQVTHLQAQVKQVPQVQFMAVLLDAQQAPAMLITLDPADGALQIQRLNDVKEGREDTMQLWALGTKGAANAQVMPVSLGVLPSRAKTVRLALNGAALDSAMVLAVSVEDKGGVDSQRGPRLPYLYQGAWIQKAL